MPWENIGECGVADLLDSDRMVTEVELGVQYVKLICGEPPAGCEVDIMWHEHDLGEYATVSLHWDPAEISDAPWKYISRAEQALSRFTNSMNWSPVLERDEENEKDLGDDEENGNGSTDNDEDEQTL